MPKTRCRHCKGAGMVPMGEIDLQLAVCRCNSQQTCYLCENSKNMGSYKECTICWGAGEIAKVEMQNSQSNKIKSRQIVRNG